MADHRKTHNGRDLDGHFQVKKVDVDDLMEDPRGIDFVRDDVRLGGAIADTGPQAGLNAQHIGELIEENRDDVGRVTGRNGRGKGKKRGRKP